MILRMEARMSSMLGSGAFSILDIPQTPSPYIADNAMTVPTQSADRSYYEVRPNSIERYTVQ